MSAKETEFSIDFFNRPVRFKAQEGVLYTRLFNIVDCDGDGLIGGAEGAAFIRRANLTNEQNREIWRLASGGKSQAKLNKDSWYVVMKLVALAQTGDAVSMQPLLAGKPLPLADFHYSNSPDKQIDNGVLARRENVFSVSVSSPVVVGSGYSRYTQYAISTYTSCTSFPVSTALVYRRFSDFEWLYNRLSDRFRGTVIPPIPEKRWSGNMDATFIEERRQSLEHYINEVCHHVKLSAALELQVVLTASSEGLAAAKEIMPNTVSYLPEAKNVSSIWSSVRDGLSSTISMSPVQQVDIKPDGELQEISSHIEEYDVRMKKAVKASNEVYQAQRAQGYELSRLGSYFSSVALQDKEDAESHRYLALVGERFEQVSDLYQDQLDRILANYITPLRYQAGKVRAVKLVMSNRESAIDEVQRANASMQRNKERIAAARASSGAAASALLAEKKLASAEDRMNTAKEQVDFIANSLKIETKRLDEDRVVVFRRFLLAYAHLQLDYCRNASRLWQEVVPELNVTKADIQRSRQRIQKYVQFRRPGEDLPSTSSL